MPSVRVEPAVSVLERAKIGQALDHAATVIIIINIISINIILQFDSTDPL
jgi:hypothetical protein